MSPFGALDLQIRESMQEFLYQLWERSGLTALLITHDLEEALLMAQKVHIMRQGPGRIVRTVAATLDRSNLSALRMERSFLELREDLAGCLRGLDQETSSCWRQDPLASTTGSSSSVEHRGKTASRKQGLKGCRHRRFGGLCCSAAAGTEPWP